MREMILRAVSDDCEMLCWRNVVLGCLKGVADVALGCLTGVTDDGGHGPASRRDNQRAAARTTLGENGAGNAASDSIPPFHTRARR
jgi:hypothetical protein